MPDIRSFFGGGGGASKPKPKPEKKAKSPYFEDKNSKSPAAKKKAAAAGSKVKGKATKGKLKAGVKKLIQKLEDEDDAYEPSGNDDDDDDDDDDDGAFEASPAKRKRDTQQVKRESKKAKTPPKKKAEAVSADAFFASAGSNDGDKKKKKKKKKRAAIVMSDDDDEDDEATATALAAAAPEDARARRAKELEDASLALALQLQEEEDAKSRPKSKKQKVKTTETKKKPSPKAAKPKPKAKAKAKPKKLSAAAKKKAAAAKRPLTLDKSTAKPTEVVDVEPPKKKNKGFWAMKNRAPPKNLGMVEIPEGKPNCLSGLVFVMTGVLDSIERDHAKQIIEQYGGRVTGSVSGKTTHILVGEEPGSKLEKGKKKGCKIVDEPQFLDLLRTLPEQELGAGIAKPKTKKAQAALKARLEAQKKKATTYAEPPKRPALAVATDAIKAAVMASHSQTARDLKDMLWVDKHRPMDVSQIIGNKLNVTKLQRYLQNFKKQFTGARGKKAKGGKRAVLLSGPPGIGKSTSAALVAKACGYKVVEFNASDVRNKASLKSTIAELTGNRALSEFWTSQRGVCAPEKNMKTCLVMDEVDGMSGNADRGGLAELVQIINKTQTPIICICNDAAHRKMATLKRNTTHIKWQRPTPLDVAPRMMQVAQQEGFDIDRASITRICGTSGADIRQVLNVMQMWSQDKGAVRIGDANQRVGACGKDFDKGPFDVINDLFQPIPTDKAKRKNWINDRLNCFFVDADMVPLLVQDGYLNKVPEGCRDPSISGAERECRMIEAMSEAADYLSDGDMVANIVRGRQVFSLMPLQGLLSAVAPAAVAGRGGANFAGFPRWFGSNSSRLKNNRLLTQVKTAMATSVSGRATDVALDYLPLLRRQLLRPLLELEKEGVEESLALLEEYDLTRDDFTWIAELGDKFARDEMTTANLETQTKSAFTRAFNKQAHGAASWRQDPKKFKVKMQKTTIKEERDDPDSEEDDDEGDEGEEDDEEAREAKAAKIKGITLKKKAKKGGSKKKKATSKKKSTKKSKK